MALLTVKQAADELDVCQETIRRAIRRKELRAKRNRLARGAPLVIAESDLEEFRLRRTTGA